MGGTEEVQTTWLSQRPHGENQPEDRTSREGYEDPPEGPPLVRMYAWSVRTRTLSVRKVQMAPLSSVDGTAYLQCAGQSRLRRLLIAGPPLCPHRCQPQLLCAGGGEG